MLAPSPSSSLLVELGAAVALHINPTKMNLMGKSQTISIIQLIVQLCKAHCPPAGIKLKMGVRSWFVFYYFDFKVWKLLFERGIKGGALGFP